MMRLMSGACSSKRRRKERARYVLSVGTPQLFLESCFFVQVDNFLLQTYKKVDLQA